MALDCILDHGLKFAAEVPGQKRSVRLAVAQAVAFLISASAGKLLSLRHTEFGSPYV